MKITSTCYIRQNHQLLLLHRTKKKIDINQGKWVGVGGKFEPGESPEECVRREVMEETGLELIDPSLRCIVTFQYLNPSPELSDWSTEYMFVYVCDHVSGQLREDCNEGELRWIPEDELDTLNLWAGDRLFLEPALAGEPFFSMKLVYQGDNLVDCQISR